jgi:signal transduction histidine kinase
MEQKLEQDGGQAPRQGLSLISKKLLALVLVPCLGALAMIGVDLYTDIHAIRDSRQLKNLCDHVIKASQLVRELQKERGLSSLYLESGGKAGRQALQAQQAETDLSLVEFRKFFAVRLQAADESLGLHLRKAMEALADLPTLRQRILASAVRPDEVLGFFGSAGGQLIESFEYGVADSKNHEVASAFCAYLNLILAREMADVENAALRGILKSNKPIEENLFNLWTGTWKGQEALLLNFKHFSSLKMLGLYQSKIEGFEALDAIRNGAQARMNTGHFGISAAAWSGLATSRIEKLAEIERIQEDEIISLADAASSSSRWEIFWELILSLLIIIVVVRTAVRHGEELAALLASEQGRASYAAKMATLGEMASGIAHEINTPLATILSKSEQLGELLEEEPLDKPCLLKFSNEIGSTALRISQVIKGLRSFARDGQADPFVPTPASKLVEDSLALCRERFRENGLALRVAEIPMDLNIDCRPTQLMQIFLNLLNNAFDAVRAIPESWVSLDWKDVGQELEFSVTDSGAPIPQEVAAKIFKPFFTTKPAGQGTGLGLSICRNIAAGHGGSLDLDFSALHPRFVLRLPKGTASKAVEMAKAA